jgi:hypothetical protein
VQSIRDERLGEYLESPVEQETELPDGSNVQDGIGTMQGLETEWLMICICLPSQIILD